MSPKTKTCTSCGQTKNVTDFYLSSNGKGARYPAAKCKKCSNKEPKPKTAARVLRNRARHRASAALIEEFRDRYEFLYAQALVEATQEAMLLAATAEGKLKYVDTPVMLRPGVRMPGETSLDRIDVARCPWCIRHHDRGHVCAKCGAAPHQAPPPRRDGIVRWSPQEGARLASQD